MSADTILQVSWDVLRHRVGAGWDALLCHVLPSALQDFEVERSAVDPEVQYEYVTIRDDTEMQREINASLGVSATLFGIGLETAYKQLNSVAYSSLSMTTILRCTITSYPTQYKEKPQLQPAVEDLLAEDVGAFRRRHGSHFVAGYVEQSSISAVTVYTATTKEQLNNFQANIHAGKGVVSVDAAASTTSLASSKNISQRVTWQSTGLNTSLLKTNPEPEDIQRIFADFTRSKAKPLTAILHNYFLITPQYEELRETQVVGGEIKAAAITALEAQRRCRLYNFTASNQLLASLMSIGQGIISTQPADPTWKSTIADYHCQLERPLVDLGCWQKRHELLEKANNNARSDWLRNVEHFPNETRTFEFGFTLGESGPLHNEIRHQRQECRVHGKVNAERERLMHISPENGLLVGFRITSHWDDRTNGPFTVKDGGVGCDHVSVWFRTQRSRGGHWSVDAWYVDSIRYRRN